ncbi:MAG: ADP-ribosyl-[dinitrogen reductase] hydrolase [Candidatus Thiodiazotropha sp.]
MTAQPPTLKERALGAYIGLAVGDALGATTEFLTPREIAEQHGTHDTISGGGWLKLKPGEVTDDTEMSLALGDSIIGHDGVEPLAVVEAFSNWMRSKPVDIGNTVRRGIINYRTRGESSVPVNEYDAGNGACMRTLPIALLCCHASDEEMRLASQRQAHTTHNNPVSDAGTETVNRMLISLLHGADKSELEALASQLVADYPEYRFDKRRAENPSGYIVDTLQVVFQAFFAHDDFESILIDVVNRGGDADTTGAIVGMLAGACYGLQAIPERWGNSLNPRVKALCMEQTDALLAMAEVRRGSA